MRSVIINGIIITPCRMLKNSVVIVEGNKIHSILPENNFRPTREDKILDADGSYVSPGFIDIHTHGGGGHDFLDNSPESFLNAADFHLKHGTTGIVPTSVASGISETEKFIENFICAIGSEKGTSNFLGVHIEGPYFSEKQKGAQKSEYLKNPDKNEYMRILDKYGEYILIWGLAPELRGACEMSRQLRKKGIISAIAHSNADYNDVEKAYENGFSHVTHLYSAMSTIHKKGACKYAGVVESSFLLDGLSVEIIADGVHVPESLIKLAYKNKGAEKICLVTDSIRAAGMEDGEYYLGKKGEGLKIIVEEDVAKLPDRSAFAGSVATADRLVRTMSKIEGIPLCDSVKMLTLTPAKILNVHNLRGSISPGKIADILFFDEQINVKLVMLNGETVYEDRREQI